MKKVVLLSLAVLFCGGANTFWKKGVPQEQMIEDQVDCKIEGNKAAPPDRQSGGWDANFELRMHVIARCMKKRGYKEVDVRSCGPFKKMPDLSMPVEIGSKTCVKGIEKAYVFIN